MTHLKNAETPPNIFPPFAIDGSQVDQTAAVTAQHPVIAFYLPQFHPTPENDEFWGPGFTEWRNVSTAQRLFEGHHQPHIPADLGYYDLRIPEVREQQVELARRYGITGFCYHHYWFHGRKILDRPFHEVLCTGRPDFPFCLSWANENWTRRWDGGDKHVLIAQQYSDADSAAHIRSLYPAFTDDRYIKLNKNPLFLIYNIASIPEPRRVTDVMRETMVRDGMGDIHLCSAETFAGRIDPRPHGFDSAVEFPPHRTWRTGVESDQSHFRFTGEFGGGLIDYRMIVHDSLQRPIPDFPLFRAVVPSWDNTARLKSRATILVNSNPELYGEWLYHMAAWTRRHHSQNDAPIFINAWNEWAEGCHLEPDQKYGHSYLNATKEALERAYVDSSAKTTLDAEPSNGRVYDALLDRDQFWLRYMAHNGTGWPAVAPNDGIKRYPLDEISITQFFYTWLSNDRARFRYLRRLASPIAKPLLRFLSHDSLR